MTARVVARPTDEPAWRRGGVDAVPGIVRSQLGWTSDRVATDRSLCYVAEVAFGVRASRRQEHVRINR